MVSVSIMAILVANVNSVVLMVSSGLVRLSLILSMFPYRLITLVIVLLVLSWWAWVCSCTIRNRLLMCPQNLALKTCLRTRVCLLALVLRKPVNLFRVSMIADMNRRPPRLTTFRIRLVMLSVWAVNLRSLLGASITSDVAVPIEAALLLCPPVCLRVGSWCIKHAALDILNLSLI